MMTTTKIETVTITETVRTSSWHGLPSGDRDEVHQVRVEMPADYDPAAITAADIEQDAALRIVDEPEADDDTCEDCHLPEADCHCGDYVVIPEGDEGGDSTEAEAVCTRAEDYCDAHAPEGASVWIEHLGSRGLRTPGTYRRSDTNGWQILGYSVPVPDAIDRLLQDAWNAACRG